jgi:hypothetical protein
MKSQASAGLSVRTVQGLLFGAVTCLIAFMHFFNTSTNITPEPGPSMSVYVRYGAIVRLNGDTTIPLIPAPQDRRDSEAEWSSRQVWKEQCVEFLEDAESCYLTDEIEADSTIQHFKSYLLPTALSGIVLGGGIASWIQSSGHALTQTEQSKETSDRLFESGLLFFNSLLWIKIGIFYLLCFRLRRVVTSRVFVLIFVSHSTLSIVMDKAFSRGSGNYAIDKVIFGSPGFRSESSLSEASIGALFDSVKATIGPGPGVVLWGITPRSAVVFVAVVMFLPILLERNWQLIWLAPIGFGIHFTNFAVLYLFFVLVVLVSGCVPKDRDVSAIVWSNVSVALYSMFQFQNRFFNYWLILFASVLLLCTSFLFSARNNRDTNVSVPSLSRVFILTYVIFFMVAISSIGYYATKFGRTDSAGFWIDGMTREVAGRLAPAVSCVALGFLVVSCARKFGPVARFIAFQSLLSKDESCSHRGAYAGAMGLTLFLAITYMSTRSLFI